MTTTTERPTRFEPDPISLTEAEHHALNVAIECIENIVGQFEIVLGDGAPIVLRNELAALQQLHDRWHRASVIAHTGQPHASDCSWCENGAPK